MSVLSFPPSSFLSNLVFFLKSVTNAAPMDATADAELLSPCLPGFSSDLLFTQWLTSPYSFLCSLLLILSSLSAYRFSFSRSLSSSLFLFSSR